MRKWRTVLPGLAALTFIIMIGMNILANVLPIGGQTTGQVSDKYVNLFAPAGITFSIWGLIYILLFAYVVYQLSYYRIHETLTKRYYEQMASLFVLSNIINTCWIVAWHYDQIFISMVLIVLLLINLIAINYVVKADQPTFKDNLLLRIPFNIYFGWITVATIANVVTYLVSVGWNGFGIADTIWTAIMIAVGAIIGIATMLHFKSIAYGLVLIWAYGGIGLKHWSESGFGGTYLSILITVGLSILIITAFVIKLIVWRAKR